MIRRSLAALCLAVACAPPGSTPAAPQSEPAPRTRAERTDHLETSRYDDVVAFVEAVAASPRVHTTTFGYSMEGRALPLVVVGAPAATAAAVLGTERTRVLVMANIHAGEVEGKEAAQMLLRELAAGMHAAWTDSLTLLFVPIYNADGNERVRLDNRAEQHGPFAGVGTRENAQGLDLNRDHMKLESPEARALVRLLVEYDPHVVVDLHTTNGSHHGYHLTYAPPLHPATDARIVDLLRERWLPAVTRAMEERGFRVGYYGNLPIREWGMTGERGWYTFDYRPRFNTHYVGLRNRFAILSEAYSYSAFEERIASTRAFVEEILDWAALNAAAIRRTTAAADAEDLRGDSIPLRAELVSSGDTIILLGSVEERVNPLSGRRYRARLEVAQAERMPHYDRFAATEREAVPGAYLVPESMARVIDLLRAHGIEMIAWPGAAPRNRDDRNPPVRVERFAIDSSTVAERPFQGHRERTVFGRWSATTERVPAGYLLVPMDQPRALLAFSLLEPRAPDGVVDWNYVDDELERQPGSYPILRLPDPLPPHTRPTHHGTR